MAVNLPNLTIQTQAQLSNGSQVKGQTVLAPSGSLGNTRQYSDLCLHNANTTIDSLGFTYTNLLGFYFQMVNDAMQTGTPTTAQLLAATVTIHFVDALSGGATDFTFTLTGGQIYAPIVVPALIASNATSIIVAGDTYVDCDIYGGILLNA